ncbi:LytR/AlgR family response regulator transcription factor [Emticicia sp. 17c]|uniref:LytR/AlgR family response regulator transcription factor n=1 Tax=Emticicia sp. 17c TaxID=3127704 RepID=UPI00301BC82C
MIKAIALDNECTSLQRIIDFCKKVDFIDLKRTFLKADEARKYLEKYPVDLLFSDIRLPNIAGVEFFKSLAQPCKFIFITAFNEFAAESYELNAIDYLLKPLDFRRFEMALNKVKGFFDNQAIPELPEKPYLCFRVNYGLVKVIIEDIVLIEGLDNYMKIYLDNQKPLVVRSTIKALLTKLPENEFLRVHRSYIVSLKKIVHVRNKIITTGNHQIPLSNNYEENFFQIFGA